MSKRLHSLIMLFVVMTGVFVQLALPQQALSYHQYYRRPVTYVRVYRHYGVYQRHPILSRTLTGTAIGALGGLAVGAIAGHHRAGRGALIGAGVGSIAGLGFGMYRNRQWTGSWF